MTDQSELTACVVCGGVATAAVEPPRRTLARGADPGDSSYSVIAVLPDISLCEEHEEDVKDRATSIGWCDDAGCRRYGEAGLTSPCGEPYKELRR